jgi:hypothetical protein
MKNKLYSISVSALFLIPFVAPWEGVSSVRAAHATEGIYSQTAAPLGVGGAASYLPIVDLDMSGLDARDAQNRPINQPSSTQDLTALFTSNLFTLAVSADAHLIRQIWSDLEAFSHLFNDLLLRMAHVIQMAVPAALLPTTKRFVHNVHNLWIALSVGLFLSAILIAPIFKNSSCQHLILRC